MTDLEKLEGRVANLESNAKLLDEIRSTVDLIYGAIATEPGGKQGLIEGHRSLGEKVSAIETKVTTFMAEHVAEKEKLTKEMLKMKVIGAAAYGGLIVLVWILEHGSSVTAALKHP